MIWDINPFDQWGVELGKELANRLAPIVENKDEFDARAGRIDGGSDCVEKVALS